MLVLKSAAGVGVSTYSRYDSLVLSDALYEALTEFSGHDPALTVLSRLRDTQGVELPPELLLEMQQFGVVKEPPPPPAPSEEAPASARRGA
jgi:hypothetical protein